MFYLVKEFLYGLDDLDFLSMLDGSNFLNKRVTVRRIYWNRIFGIISNVVALETKREKQALAVAMRRVVIQRLGSVSKSSFVRFFTTKFMKSEANIFRKINQLRKSISKAMEARFIAEEKTKFASLSAWLESVPVNRVIRKVIKLYSHKNNVEITSFPDLRFKKLDDCIACYVPNRNAIEIDPTNRSDESIKLSFLHEFLHFLFQSSGLEAHHHTAFYWRELKKLCSRTKVSGFVIGELVPDPVTQVEDEVTSPDTENESTEVNNVEVPSPDPTQLSPRESDDDEDPIHEEISRFEEIFDSEFD